MEKELTHHPEVGCAEEMGIGLGSQGPYLHSGNLEHDSLPRPSSEESIICPGPLAETDELLKVLLGKSRTCRILEETLLICESGDLDKSQRYKKD